ncbi:ATP-grasp domain-containing protein [Nocardioides sp. GCM10028917]|uniref:ATP-grasp domain-containing protein n=1 Tax=Nocardioides sp. GCM10028917 TaxID=3273408 RepID=UPI003606BE71
MSHVLVTCAGRRVSLVRAFVEAAHERGLKVLAADPDPLAPALVDVDFAVRVPSLADPGYLPALLDTVREHDVSLVVPTIDTELPLLARHSRELADAGATALVSNTAFVHVCGDKALTGEAFAAHGVDVPRSWLPEDGVPDDLPDNLVVKPRNGSSSKDVHMIRRDQVLQTVAVVPQPIIQERLTGPEVTVDALLDLEGRPVHYVPRTRLKTLGGESIQGVTLPHDELGPWIENVLAACSELGARGPVTLQFFRTDRGPVLIEVNPRFGGGFPLTLAAGGDYPAWLLDELAGATTARRFGDYRAGLYMTRYMVEHFTDALRW